MISSRSLLWVALMIGMPTKAATQGQQPSRALPLVDGRLRVSTRDCSSATTADLPRLARAPGRADRVTRARSASARATHVGWGVAIGAITGGLFAAAISSSQSERAEGLARPITITGGALIGATLGALLGLAMPE